VDLKDIVFRSEGVNWIQLTHDRVQWRVLVNTGIISRKIS
jgi:hypothetical protein